MNARLVVFAAVALGALTGCPSISTSGMARTLNQGSMQGFVSPGFDVLGGLTVPQVEVGGRYGVTDHIEFGAKAWFFGASLDGKFALLRAPSMQGGVDLSLNPSVAYFGLGVSGTDGNTGNLGLLTVQLPVLVGVNFSGHQLMIGPKLVGHVGSGEAASGLGVSTNAGQLVGVGSSLGVAFKLGEEFRLMPEITYVRYVWANGGDPAGAFFIQGGLNVLFGGRYEAPAKPLETP